MRWSPRVHARRPPHDRRTKWAILNRRRGRDEARNLLRWPTRAVEWKATYPASTPAAACQRRSTSRRSVASRAESLPSTGRRGSPSDSRSVAGPAPTRVPYPKHSQRRRHFANRGSDYPRCSLLAFPIGSSLDPDHWHMGGVGFDDSADRRHRSGRRARLHPDRRGPGHGRRGVSPRH